MSLEAIAERIAADAAREAEALVGAAEAEREAALAEAWNEAGQAAARERAGISAEMDDLGARLAGHVSREAAMIVETATRRLLDTALDEAVKRLGSLPRDRAEELVSAVLSSCPLGGEVEVSTSGEPWIDQAFLDGHSGPDRRFRLAGRHHGGGGLVLSAGGVSVNATYGTIASLARETIVMELSRRLAGQPR
jgi:vacuolar-type H+-ATPase subunit E/Vma4